MAMTRLQRGEGTSALMGGTTRAIQMAEDYIVAWLYEPGMPVALAIAYSSEPPIYGNPQTIAITPNEYWDATGYGERQRIYRDYLIEEAHK